jgi:hypothetical protein
MVLIFAKIGQFVFIVLVFVFESGGEHTEHSPERFQLPKRNTRILRLSPLGMLYARLTLI